MTAEKTPLYGQERQSSLIEKIISQDKQTFFAWTRHVKEPRLDLAPKAVRYLIAPNVFALADDPRNVHVRIVSHRKKGLHFFAVEEKPQPLTAMHYLDTIGNPPGSVDTMHYKFSRELKDGLLQPNDFIFYRMNLSLEQDNNGTPYLYESQYDDRETLRRKGMGAGAHERLNEVAAAIGLRYITAKHSNSSLTFFTDKLQRIPLGDLPDHLKQKLVHPKQQELDSHYLTHTAVQVLFPKDLER